MATKTGNKKATHQFVSRFASLNQFDNDNDNDNDDVNDSQMIDSSTPTSTSTSPIMRTQWRRTSDENINDGFAPVARKQKSRNMNSSNSVVNKFSLSIDSMRHKKLVKDLLLEFTSMENLITSINEAINSITNGSYTNPKGEIAKLLETCIEWSLHEIFTLSKDLNDRLLEMTECDEYKAIHWAIWARIKVHPEDMINMKSFTRNDDDILKTLQVCMNAGYTPLDTNTKKNESSIGSLNTCMKKKYISQDLYNRMYNELMNPPQNALRNMCKYIMNLMSNDQITYLSPIVKFLMYKNSALFGKFMVDELLDIGTNCRDKKGYYQRVTDRIALISKMIGLTTMSATHDFAKFFSDTKISIKPFSQVIGMHCLNLNPKEQNHPLTGQPLNTDILGAIIGHTAPSDIMENYVIKIHESYRSIARTSLVHHKAKNENYVPSKKIIDIIIANYNDMPGYEQFMVSEVYKYLTGQHLKPIDKVIKNTNNESNNTKPEIKINFEFLNLTDVPTSYENASSLADDFFYGIEKLKEKHTDDVISSAYYEKAFGSIKSELHINLVIAFAKYAKISTPESIEEIYENMLDDSPKWAPKLYAKLINV